MMEKLKQVTSKTLISAFFLAIAIVFAAIMSFVPYLISLEKVGTASFWTDEIMSLGFVLIGFVTMMSIAMNMNSMNPKSQIAEANAKYVAKRPLVKNVNDFKRWHDEIYLPSDKKAVIRRYLDELMIDDESILELDRIDIKAMEEAKTNLNGRDYPSLSKEQVRMLIRIKEGKVRMPKTNAKYYLTTKSYKQAMTISEEVQNEEMKKGLTLGFDIASKLAVSFTWAFILALFVRDTTQGSGGSNLDAWGKFAIRMMSIGSGMFSGFLSGYKINNIDAHYIELRNIVIDFYLSSVSH